MCREKTASRVSTWVRKRRRGWDVVCRERTASRVSTWGPGQARDPGTFLQVQMFEQLLGLCAQGQAAAGQVNAMRCSEEQLRTLSSACYADKGHTQMRCEDCLPIVSQLATVCPVSFTDGEPLAFATACSGAHPRQPKFCTRAPIR